MAILALDWNATSVRAVQAPAGGYAVVLPLEPPHAELPLAISMANRTPEVGAAALGQCRHTPDLVCRAFLPFLSAEKGHGPHWQSGRHSFDARSACELVWRQLQNVGSKCQGIVLTLPGYLEPA